MIACTVYDLSWFYELLCVKLWYNCGPRYSTERNGTESVVALFYGTEWNTANMANIHKSNLML